MKTNSLGIYVHIPFCESKCVYCDFTSYCNMDDRIEDYFGALYSELAMYSKEHENSIVDSVFIGGGTPSYVDSKYIVKLMDILKSEYELAEDAEISIESNPNSLSYEKAIDYFNSGINRISIGAQSFNDKLLKRLGRVHSAAEVKSAVENAKRAGFQNINIVLMSGIPEQVLADIDDSLMMIRELGITHLSYYSLILEEQTKLFRDYEKGLVEIPDEDTDREMYHRLVNALKDMGMEQYEVSNFAIPGYECAHNLKYWRVDDYLGIGISSHSSVGKYRYANTHSLNSYIDRISAGEKPVDSIEEISLDERLNEYIIMGLRLNSGIDFSEVKSRFGIDFKSEYSREIETNLNSGLIEMDERSLTLTEVGRDLANIVELDFYR